jgi:hypothetical protein
VRSNNGLRGQVPGPAGLASTSAGLLISFQMCSIVRTNLLCAYGRCDCWNIGGYKVAINAMHSVSQAVVEIRVIACHSICAVWNAVWTSCIACRRQLPMLEGAHDAIQPCECKSLSSGAGLVLAVCTSLQAFGRQQVVLAVMLHGVPQPWFAVE